MTRGVDISKFQSPSAMDGWDFVILNVEDPGFAEKARRAHELGIPWDIYKWIFPGASGSEMFARAHDLVNAVGLPGRQPGYWADYEESGVAAHQVGEWFAAADAAGVKVGWYTYLNVVNAEGNHAPDRPLWLAYYPGTDDGSYQPSMSDDARARRATIHQFTTTSGTLDVNIVLDDTWWSEWTGDDDMTPDQVRAIVREEMDAWLNENAAPAGPRFVLLLDKYRVAVETIVDEWLTKPTAAGARFKQLLDTFNR
jgi:hypothetical protein